MVDTQSWRGLKAASPSRSSLMPALSSGAKTSGTSGLSSALPFRKLEGLKRKTWKVAGHASLKLKFFVAALAARVSWPGEMVVAVGGRVP